MRTLKTLVDHFGSVMVRSPVSGSFHVYELRNGGGVGVGIYRRLRTATEGCWRLPKVKARQSRLNVLGGPGPTNGAPWGGVCVGTVVLFTSESGDAQLGPNQGQTWPIAKWSLSCQNTRRVKTGDWTGETWTLHKNYETAQLGHTAVEVQPLTLSIQTLVPT